MKKIHDWWIFETIFLVLGELNIGLAIYDISIDSPVWVRVLDLLVAGVFFSSLFRCLWQRALILSTGFGHRG